MDMGLIIRSVIVGIVFYNFICTFILLCYDLDENLSTCLNFGIFFILFKIINYIYNLYEMIFFRALIEERSTGIIYHCKCKYYHDFEYVIGKVREKSYGGKYKGITSHTLKWIAYPSVTREMLKDVTCNCNYCIHDEDDCTNDNPLCECDECGYILNPSKFERKKSLWT